MKQKIIRVCLWGLLFILLACIGFLLLPLNSTTYSINNQTLEIPRLSIWIENQKEHTFSARNIRSTIALNKDMEKIISKLEKINCNSHDYYYNKEEDYTIKEYGVIKRFVLNEIWIDYEPGNYCTKENEKSR